LHQDKKIKPKIDPIAEYFGFEKMPFSRNLPTVELLSLRGQNEMQARLSQAMRERSIALVTGRGGSGKSTAVRLYASGLDPNRVRVLYVPNPASGLTGIFREILRSVGYEPSYFKPHLVCQVRNALTEVAQRGRQPLLLVDEAHRLTNDWLEDLRMLLSSDMDSESLATLVLVGHPELATRLRMACHEALWGRINYRYRLKPLPLRETAEYIGHHVRVAGYRGDALFSDGFIARAHEYASGLPRQLNQICTYALVAAMTTGARIIDESVFDKARFELDGGEELDG
jgi:type II secretory pathway predicted ATPase ExeA